jgi:hypothetical protein
VTEYTAGVRLVRLICYRSFVLRFKLDLCKTNFPDCDKNWKKIRNRDKSFLYQTNVFTVITICKTSWLRHYATSRKVAGSIPDEVIGFFNRSNTSSRTMAPGSTQPLTEMSTRNRPVGKGRPARGANNVTAICEPIVYKMWEPWRLTSLWAFVACYRDSFTFLNTATLRSALVWTYYSRDSSVGIARGYRAGRPGLGYEHAEWITHRSRS